MRKSTTWTGYTLVDTSYEVRDRPHAVFAPPTSTARDAAPRSLTRISGYVSGTWQVMRRRSAHCRTLSGSGARARNARCSSGTKCSCECAFQTEISVQGSGVLMCMCFCWWHVYRGADACALRPRSALQWGNRGLDKEHRRRTRGGKLKAARRSVVTWLGRRRRRWWHGWKGVRFRRTNRGERI